jgi:hypothetical protein
MGGPSTRATKFLVAFALGLTATLAQAAGFRFIEVPVDADGPVLNGAMWYPCSEPPDTIVLGPYALSLGKDCPIGGDKRAKSEAICPNRLVPLAPLC